MRTELDFRGPMESCFRIDGELELAEDLGGVAIRQPFNTSARYYWRRNLVCRLQPGYGFALSKTRGFLVRNPVRINASRV